MSLDIRTCGTHCPLCERALVESETECGTVKLETDSGTTNAADPSALKHKKTVAFVLFLMLFFPGIGAILVSLFTVCSSSAPGIYTVGVSRTH